MRIIDNINNKKYGINLLDVTGPFLKIPNLHKISVGNINYNGFKFKFFQYFHTNDEYRGAVFDNNNSKIILLKFKNSASLLYKGNSIDSSF